MNRGARIALTLFVVLLLVPAIAWTIWNARAGAELRRALGVIEAKGWPTTIGQFRPPAVPDAENAAPLLNRAFLQMAGGRTEFQPLDEPFEELSKVWKGSTNLFAQLHTDAALAADVKAKLAAPPVAEVLGLLREASARPGCNFDLKYEQGAALLLPHMAPSRNAVRMLCLGAWVKARDGDLPAAMKDLRAGLVLSRMVAEDRVLISVLIAFAGTQHVLDALPHILAAAPAGAVTADDLDGLAGELARAREGFKPALVHCLDGERIALGGWAFEGVLNGTLNMDGLGGLPVPRGMLWAYANPLRPLFKQDYAFYVTILGEMREVAGKPFDPATAGAIARRVESVPRWAILSSLVMPALDSVFVKAAEMECTLDAARVGLALEKHRLANGAYPASLEELQLPGGVPTDPFTAKPLIYKPTAAGVQVYGFAKNAKDDGGQRRTVDNKDYDVGWEMRRP